MDRNGRDASPTSLEEPALFRSYFAVGRSFSVLAFSGSVFASVILPSSIALAQSAASPVHAAAVSSVTAATASSAAAAASNAPAAAGPSAISGTVTDTTGAVIPGAHVALTTAAGATVARNNHGCDGRVSACSDGGGKLLADCESGGISAVDGGGDCGNGSGCAAEYCAVGG